MSSAVKTAPGKRSGSSSESPLATATDSNGPSIRASKSSTALSKKNRRGGGTYKGLYDCQWNACVCVCVCVRSEEPHV